MNKATLEKPRRHVDNLRMGKPKEPQPKPVTFSDHIAVRMEKLRLKANLSVPALATAVTDNGYPIGKQAIYNWINFSRDIPLDAIPHLAKSLGVSVAELIPSKS